MEQEKFQQGKFVNNESAVIAAEVAKKVASDAAQVAQDVVKKATETAEKVLLFSQTISYIQIDIAEIKSKLDNKFVTKDEFSTVRAIVYGMVGIVLMSFIGAVITLVFIK